MNRKIKINSLKFPIKIMNCKSRRNAQTLFLLLLIPLAVNIFQGIQITERLSVTGYTHNGKAISEWNTLCSALRNATSCR